MKISNYDIDISFSTVQTFDGELPIDKGFWLEHDMVTKETDTIRGSDSFMDLMWKDTIYRAHLRFGFKKWGVWIYIQKDK